MDQFMLVEMREQVAMLSERCAMLRSAAERALAENQNLKKKLEAIAPTDTANSEVRLETKSGV